MSDVQTEHPTGGEMASAISNGVVQLVREYTGRGPTKARTYIKDDLISVVLEDALTKGERSLVRDGEADLVLKARKAYQGTMRSDLIELVERLSAREVLAFLSDNHLEPDIAVESFVLTPVDSKNPWEHAGNGGGPAQAD